MDFGGTSLTPFAYYDPGTSCWRTFQHSLFEDLTESSPTWPRAGMTSGGCAYELPMPELPIGATGGSGMPHLLKTPTAQLAVNGGSQHPDKRKAGGHGPTLADEVEHLLPTPTARDHKGPNQRGDTSCPHGALLPTPTVADSRGSRNATASRKEPGKANNGWTLTDIFWTGDSSGPPSDSGKPSSDEPPPNRLSPEAAATES